MVITISHTGYIKRTALTEFRTQNRGGVGVRGSSTKEDDFIEHVYVANMHSTMLLFTELGRCYWLKVYNIPEGSRASKGRAIQNILNLSADNKVQAYINVPTLSDEEYINNHYIVLVTKRGTVKKTLLEEFSRPRVNGVNAVSIREGDELVEVALTNGNEELLIAAREGRCVRFNERDVRAMGRTATGVRGINIEEDDCVIGMIAYDPNAEDAKDHTVMVVSENGIGKRSEFEEDRITARGGKGVKTIAITPKTGKLVAMKNVTEANDLMIINRSGITIRMPVEDIHVAGRATQGVKLINIREGDSITAVSVVEKSEEAEKNEETAIEKEDTNN